jgi:hypothetical protein
MIYQENDDEPLQSSAFRPSGLKVEDHQHYSAGSVHKRPILWATVTVPCGWHKAYVSSLLDLPSSKTYFFDISSIDVGF